MTEQNQKIMYDNFISIANNVQKDVKGRDFKPLVRENCAKNAADILKSFPHFAKKKEAETPQEDNSELGSKTKDELKAMLDEKSIKHDVTATKADLIALLGA